MLNTNQQCALEAMKANHMPGCISKRAAGSWRTVVIPLQLAFLRPHLVYCVMSSFEFPCKRHWQARLRPMEGHQDCGAGQSRMGWGNWVWLEKGLEEKAGGWEGDLMVIFNYLKGCYRQDGARLLSEVCSQRRNVKWSQGAVREILSKYKKEIYRKKEKQKTKPNQSINHK